MLRTVVKGSDEELQNTFDFLRVMSDYKYNSYEIYQPGRLFLENLYLWLSQFTDSEKEIALSLVTRNLVFVSEREFHQLTHTVYNDVVRKRQMAVAAGELGYREYMVSRITRSESFRFVQRATLYVGLSDGARIDYFRRQNPTIGNEQVLSYYLNDREKLDSTRERLGTDLATPTARFRMLVLINDFCGSGRTLLREVVEVNVGGNQGVPAIPDTWRPRLSYSIRTRKLELVYADPLTGEDVAQIRSLLSDPGLRPIGEELLTKYGRGDTVLAGAFKRL